MADLFSFLLSFPSFFFPTPYYFKRELDPSIAYGSLGLFPSLVLTIAIASEPLLSLSLSLSFFWLPQAIWSSQARDQI